MDPSVVYMAGLAQRARIVLLSGEGLGTTAVAARIGVSRPTVILWRNRYLEGGLDALADLPRPGANQTPTRRPS